MDEETIKRLQKAWQDEQSRLWREFKDSLTPEQRRLFQAHRRATGTLAKLRRWRNKLRQGKPLRGKEVPWPGNETER